VPDMATLDHGAGRLNPVLTHWAVVLIFLSLACISTLVSVSVSAMSPESKVSRMVATLVTVVMSVEAGLMTNLAASALG
jgi:hypothetical protein